MNNMTRRTGGWNVPVQQSCPNCQPQENAAQGVIQQPMQTAAVNRGPQTMPNGYITQLPPQESTSNYADLGMAPTMNSGMGMQGMMTGMSGSTTYAPGTIPLQSLVGNQPSPTELPGLTAINTSNQVTAYRDANLQYLNGFLITQIGKSITVTFLIGSNSMDVRSGILVGVGANYILINEFESNDIVACDFYSIKFVKIYY